MATTVDPNSPAGKALQQQADQAGISVQALQALQAQYPQVYTANNQGGQYGMSSGGSYGQNPGLTSALSALGAIKQSGGLGGQQATNPSSIPGQVSSDPMNLATNLGAAALNQPAVYNPTPGQIPQGSKGGVSAVQSPTSSGSVPTVPQGPWSTQAGVFTTQGQGQGNAAQAVPQAASGGTPTPTAIPNPRGGQAAAPYATAPAAPGVQTGAIAPVSAAAPPPAPTGGVDPHTQQALAHAGMAMYAHYGGDPATATPEDISNFHTQLQDHIGSLFGGQGQSGIPTQGQPQGVAQAGATALGAATPPTKMSTGGMVPGRGNQDTVPALLTPGEYVIPKQQAAQIFGGREPIRMADGGLVPEGQSKPPGETRHEALTNPATGQPVGNMGSQATQQSSQSAPAQAPAAPGGIGSSAMDYLAQARQMQAANLNSQGASGGGYNIPASQGGGYIGASPGVGESGYMYPSQSAATAAGDVGPGVAGGTAPAGAQGMATAGAISDLASGLTKAAQTYANSIGSWKPQADATEKFRNNVASGPAATFKQDQTT